MKTLILILALAISAHAGSLMPSNENAFLQAWQVTAFPIFALYEPTDSMIPYTPVTGTFSFVDGMVSWDVTNNYSLHWLFLPDGEAFKVRGGSEFQGSGFIGTQQSVLFAGTTPQHTPDTGSTALMAGGVIALLMLWKTLRRNE